MPLPTPVNRSNANDTEPPAQRNTRRTAARSPRRLIRDEFGVILVLALLVIVVGWSHPTFLHSNNLLSTTQSSVYVGLMSIGMVFALAMREVDLSVGGIYALGIVVGAQLITKGINPWVAALIVLIISGLLGMANGAISTYIQVPSFIVTLATAMLFRGVALAIANGKQIGGLPSSNSFFTVVGGDIAGVPTSVWVLVVAVIVLSVVFTRTRTGARIRSVGSNPDAAAFSGLPITRTRVVALGTSGLLAGLASVMGLAFFVAGDPTVGNGYELSAIAACIIGGTPLMGGKGSVLGAALGSLILSVVATSLVFFRVPINWTTFATGAVILAAVALDSLLRRSRGHGFLPRRRPAEGG